MAKEIVLAGACRTALGKFGGSLTNTPAVELGAIVIKEAKMCIRDSRVTCRKSALRKKRSNGISAWQ